MPCPHCGATGEPRIVWSAIDANQYLEFVLSLDQDSMGERRIAIVLLCALLEMLLTSIDWELLQAHAKPREIIELVLAAHGGRNRLINLHNKLAKRKLGEILEQTGLGWYMEDWAKMCRIRTFYVHASPYEGEPPDEERRLISEFIQHSLPALVHVHNASLAKGDTAT